MTQAEGESHPLSPQQIEEKLQEENAKELEEIVSEYFKREDIAPCCNNPNHGLYMMKEDRQDSLDLIFQKQKQLLEYLNQSKPDNYYTGPERYPFEKVMHMMTAMSDEFSEVRAGISWKHWKTYEHSDLNLLAENEVELADNDPLTKKMFDAFEEGGPTKPFLTDEQRTTQKQILDNSKLQYLQKEWIDILHFWVQGAQELGLDSKKTLELYLNKNSENHSRYQEGY